MPQCKRDMCKEPAVGSNVKTEGFKRKQYCAAHYEEYKAKQRVLRDRQRALPECESGISPDCMGKVQRHRAERGETVCQQCENLADELHEAHQRERTKQRQLDTAETVEELKEWIRKYVI